MIVQPLPQCVAAECCVTVNDGVLFLVVCRFEDVAGRGMFVRCGRACHFVLAVLSYVYIPVFILLS